MTKPKFDTARKYVTDERGETIVYHPAVRSVRRLSVVRLERIKVLKRMFDAGKSVQEIARETGWKKHVIYQEMYNMKKLGMLSSDFKNPFSVWFKGSNELLKEVEKNGKEG